MEPHLFLKDLQRKPEVLRGFAARVRQENPWAFLTQAPERIVFLGMGSSAYAAGIAAARLRARGIVAVCELASSDLLPDWGPETLVVAISASGSSGETLDAVNRLKGDATTVALTNTPDSQLAAGCDRVVLMHAEREVGGVACRSFQHTLAALLALEAQLGGSSRSELVTVLEQSANATQELLEKKDVWLPDVRSILDGPHGTHLAAPARRLSSALQGALMLREGPRRFAVGCEVGDWAHVDVYLTKNTDYRLLVFAGSRWDDGIVEWTGPRETAIVAVGGTFPGARCEVRYPHDDRDDVRLLTEVLVPELLAADLWLEQGAEGSPDTLSPGHPGHEGDNPGALQGRLPWSLRFS